MAQNFTVLTVPFALRSAPALLTGLVLLLGGCASTSSPSPTPPVERQTPVSVLDVGSGGQAGADTEGRATEDPVDVEVVDLESGDLVEEGDLDAPDQPLSTREALDRAIAWTEEGLRLYETGDLTAARGRLRNAQAVLLEADLPESMQSQGLAALQSSLSPDLANHDLAAVVRLLEVAAENNAGASEMAERDYIEHEVRRLLMRFGSSSPQEAYLETFVDEVEFFIDYYRGKQRTFFERAYERRFKYWPVIEEVFAARNIPTELGYMALVESGYNPRARSHANARGLWQFIPGTGKRYGLYRTEDFYDVQKSTEAAAEYLLDLIAIFGSPSFLLATAAYNAGEGRIQGCLRKLDDPFSKRSFWEIRGCLAKETREYVPRIMAAVVIGSNPERFGFQLMGPEEVRERYDVVTIPAITRLSEVARQSGVSVADLRTANTDLASTATSTPSRNFPLYIPKGGGERLVGSLAANPSAGAPWPQEASRVAESTPEVRPVRPPQVKVQMEPTPSPRGETVEYVARRGDTLVEIAKSHGVKVSDLKAWNPFLKRRVLFRGDRLTIHSAGSASPSRTSTTVEYRVRRGDNLSDIAQRHGVPWRSIAEWNNLRSPYRLRVGQRLTIRGGGGQSSGRPRVVYTVKRGNSLQTIAQVFSVRYRDIMSWNSLRSSRLQPGQELVIHPRRTMRAERVRVKRGDTVGKIARRHGVSVSDILTVNGLSARSVIRPGQRLLVYIPG